MAKSYRCAYCGSKQTYSGSGPRVCSNCGATQKDDDVAAAQATPASHRRWGLVVLIILVVAGVVAWHLLGRSKKATQPQTASTQAHSRIVPVNGPSVRKLPAGSDLSALDLLRSAPANAGSLFDTKFLSITTPRPMKDTEGYLFYVGEVSNHSPDHTAIAPSVQMGVVKGGRVVETSDLNFSDLPPGGHTPAFFQWKGDTRDIDSLQFRWKPVQGYATAGRNHPRLETTITGKKMTPGSVTVNFSYTYRFVTADVQGTVTNRGDATATGIQLYLTLRDAKGRVTGYKEKDLDPIAPGEQQQYDISADQWGDPVASIDVQALAASQPKL